MPENPWEVSRGEGAGTLPRHRLWIWAISVTMRDLGYYLTFEPQSPNLLSTLGHHSLSHPLTRL